MSIWQLPMGTYYSQLARGFLFPSSQPVPASKSWEPDQNYSQMLGRVAKLRLCSGRTQAFQLHNEVASSQKPPDYKKSRKRQLCTSQARARATSFQIWRWDDWFSSCKQMLRAVGSVERSCCPGLRPYSGGFSHAVKLYRTSAACCASLQT